MGKYISQFLNSYKNKINTKMYNMTFEVERKSNKSYKSDSRNNISKLE